MIVGTGKTPAIHGSVRDPRKHALGQASHVGGEFSHEPSQSWQFGSLESRRGSPPKLTAFRPAWRRSVRGRPHISRASRTGRLGQFVSPLDQISFQFPQHAHFGELHGPRKLRRTQRCIGFRGITVLRWFSDSSMTGLGRKLTIMVIEPGIGGY